MRALAVLLLALSACDAGPQDSPAPDPDVAARAELAAVESANDPARLLEAARRLSDRLVERGRAKDAADVLDGALGRLAGTAQEPSACFALCRAARGIPDDARALSAARRGIESSDPLLDAELAAHVACRAEEVALLDRAGDVEGATAALARLDEVEQAAKDANRLRGNVWLTVRLARIDHRLAAGDMDGAIDVATRSLAEPMRMQELGAASLELIWRRAIALERRSRTHSDAVSDALRDVELAAGSSYLPKNARLLIFLAGARLCLKDGNREKAREWSKKARAEMDAMKKEGRPVDEEDARGVEEVERELAEKASDRGGG